MEKKIYSDIYDDVNTSAEDFSSFIPTQPYPPSYLADLFEAEKHKKKSKKRKKKEKKRRKKEAKKLKKLEKQLKKLQKEYGCYAHEPVQYDKYSWLKEIA